jgi:hypothetical protein
MTYDETMSGGAVLGGVPFVTSFVNEPPNGLSQGGVRGGTAALVKWLRIVSYASSGNIVTTGGSYNGGVTGVKTHASGGVTVSNDANPSIVNFKFNKNLIFLWHTIKRIIKDHTFLWNVGRLPIFWFRIVSKPLDKTKCPGDPCCQKMVANIHARTITELCEKMKKRRFDFAIESVEKFRRPAESSVVADLESKGQNFDCNSLSAVEICSVPACADFCLDVDARQGLGFGITVQVDAFFFHTATGSAHSGGTATTRLVRIIPNFPHVTTGGVALEGEAVCKPNSYTMRDGIIAGGTARVESTRNFYIGGAWPDHSAVAYPSLQVSDPQESDDKAWDLPERAGDDDALYTQSDISFSGTTARLVLTQFRLQLPTWASVTGIRVRIDRYATQIGVRDEEVYLVKNGELFSDNLADTTNDWPLLSSIKSYGSINGVTELAPWRDPDADDYLGEFATSDLGDQTFGVLLRATATRSLDRILVKVNYASIEVFYEDPNGSIVRVGGEVRAVSPSYHYTASGKTVVSCLSVFQPGLRHVSDGKGLSGTSGVVMGGVSSVGYKYVTTGGIVMGGESFSKPSFQNIFMMGGPIVGGAARISPYFETGQGGARASGRARRYDTYHVEATGGVSLDSRAFTPEGKFSYSAVGGITTGSNVRVRSSVWRWASDGNLILMSGSAGQRPSDIGTPVQNMSFGMTLLETNALFPNDVELGDAEPLTGDVNKCGCTTIPLIVELKQNIARDNLLAKFLVRNNYPIPNILKMRYNTGNDSWQSNLHYRGVSAERNGQEAWDLIFEVQCTDVVGGVSIGRKIWKLAVQIVRKNLGTREDYDSRIIVSVLPESICGSNENRLDYEVVYDTQLDFSVVTPDATIYQNMLFDNIGLFRNPSWISDPNLIFKISQLGMLNSGTRVDVTDAVLV